MVKMMIFLTRPDEVEPSAFAAWWLERHRPLADKLPGLQRYEVNFLPPGGPCDAIVEQWFESEAAAQAAYDSPQGKVVAADALANVKSRSRLAVEAHAFAPGA